MIRSNVAERRYDVKPPIFSSGVVRIRESLHRERFQGVEPSLTSVERGCYSSHMIVNEEKR